MNIQDNYLKNKKNIFFSENKDIQTHREKLINIFENDRFDKKNNESLKNINLKNFIDFKYKYLIPEETSVINNNQENSYSIVSVNGQCSSFKDDKIEITKILDEDYNDFSKNNTIENNDHFVNLNSLFLNSGFKIVIKKNNKIKVKITNIVTDDDLKLSQVNDILISHFVRRKLDPLALGKKDKEKAGGDRIRQTISLVEGIEQDVAKKITSEIKSSKMKVQAKINGNELRIDGKKRDDLQSAMQLIEDLQVGIPVQFINFRD